MELLLITVAFAVVCLVSPLVSRDTSDARAESARPDAGWYPAAPDRS
jgi:hypothetical protein